MLSVIAIGIPKCNCKDLQNIDCAFNDAQNIYKTFEKVVNGEFSHFNSICLSSINSDEFRSLIRSLSFSYNHDDIFILYFSGHGKLEGNTLNLCFSDADDSGRGYVSAGEIVSLVANNKARIILILDCCYSGAALSNANKDSIFDKRRISVISSTLPYTKSRFKDNGVEGSVFTNNLCNAMSLIFENQDKLSINKIFEYIEKLGYSQCLVNVEEGQTDIQLKQYEDVNEKYKNFPQHFLKRISEININSREALWYSLMDIPSTVKKGVFEQYFSSPLKLASEPSWLVRRAIGSAISVIDNSHQYKYEVIIKLIDSYNWMENCIGYIGARYILETPELVEKLKRKITQPTAIMDSVWLANLYISDSDYRDLELGLASKLSKTSWGIIDLWNRFSKVSKSKEELLKCFENQIKDKELLQPLYLHLFFDDSFSETKRDINKELSESLLMHFLYKQIKRGRLPENSKLKWVFSLLYGSWRDQINVDLKDFIDNFDEKIISHELQLAQNTPLVEMKMSIYNYMEIDRVAFEKYKDYLMWGLTDAHPWVRRVAIRAFKQEPEKVANAFINTFDRELYPGTFDLILEASMIGIDTSEYLKKYNLTTSEKESLSWALNLR